MERPFVRFSIQHIARHSPDETAQANMCDNIDKVYRPTPPPPFVYFSSPFSTSKILRFTSDEETHIMATINPFQSIAALAAPREL